MVNGGEIWYGTLDNLLRLDLRLPNERLLRNVGNVSWFDDEHVVFTEAGGRSTAFKAKIDTNEFNTRIVDCQGFSDSTADNEDIKYFPVRHLSNAAAILGVADSLDELVEATDEDVDELAAETGMPKLKQRKFKRALAGVRGAT